MQISRAISAVIPSLEGSTLAVLARTTAPLTAPTIARLAASGTYHGIRKVLLRLVESGVVSEVIAGPHVLYAANREHILWPSLEALLVTADSAQLTLADRLAAAVRRSLAAIERDADDLTIALFGSVARGDDTPESDVDLLAIFVDDFDEVHSQQLLDEISRDVTAWTGNACNIYSISRAELQRLVLAKDPIVASWETDARTICGPELQPLIAAIRREPNS